jgi:hypothetical protein
MQDSDQQPAATTLSWRIKDEPGSTVVEFSGELNERAHFAALRPRLKGQVVFHMAAVRRVNSGGVRMWAQFMQDLCGSADVALTHCSPVVVAQLNMSYRLCGKAHVLSFYAPYACSRCDHEEERLLYVHTHFPNGEFTHMPQFHCGSCGAVMEFEESVERYLGFLKES